MVPAYHSPAALAARAKTVQQLLASSVKASPVQKTAYEELLTYASDNCG